LYSGLVGREAPCYLELVEIAGIDLIGGEYLVPFRSAVS